LGDPSGIGPEVALKALAAQPEDDFEYLLLGDSELARRLNRDLGLNLSFGARFVLEHTGRALPEFLACGSPMAAESAMAALMAGADQCLRGQLAGMVTAPVNKESIIRLGKPFMGQTEFLAERAGATRAAMMLLGCDDRGRWLRVALVTTHIPLRAVADHLSQAKIQMTIELAARACHDLGLPRARVAVCGLNPHAGEGGEIGTEEITLIAPAVELARRNDCDVEGPIAADTLFYYAFRGDFDAVVAMYHDQGLAPLKMIGFESGINWTLGLPFIRTSPDHGTAYDIAGQNKANPQSMIAAINLAKSLAVRGGSDILTSTGSGEKAAE
jgi:4-hydroxythreonine-4-phosphate dehydrogenase